MTEQSPEEIHLKHIRAPDYKEISADGTLHKIVDNHLVITFYIEDSRVTGEVLRRDGQDPPTYRIAAIEEEKQRLDVVAVRVPTKAILGLAAAVAERLTQLPPGKAAKSVKKVFAPAPADLRWPRRRRELASAPNIRVPYGFAAESIRLPPATVSTSAAETAPGRNPYPWEAGEIRRTDRLKS